MRVYGRKTGGFSELHLLQRVQINEHILLLYEWAREVQFGSSNGLIINMDEPTRFDKWLIEIWNSCGNKGQKLYDQSGFQSVDDMENLCEAIFEKSKPDAIICIMRVEATAWGFIKALREDGKHQSRTDEAVFTEHEL